MSAASVRQRKVQPQYQPCVLFGDRARYHPGGGDGPAGQVVASPVEVHSGPSQVTVIDHPAVARAARWRGA